MPQTTTEGAPHPRKSKVEIPHPSDEIFTQETLFYFLWVNPNFFPIEKKAEIFILINPRRELFNIFGLGKTQKKLATVRTVRDDEKMKIAKVSHRNRVNPEETLGDNWKGGGSIFWCFLNNFSYSQMRFETPKTISRYRGEI